MDFPINFDKNTAWNITYNNNWWFLTLLNNYILKMVKTANVMLYIFDHSLKMYVIYNNEFYGTTLHFALNEGLACLTLMLALGSYTSTDWHRAWPTGNSLNWWQLTLEHCLSAETATMQLQWKSWEMLGMIKGGLGAKHWLPLCPFCGT